MKKSAGLIFFGFVIIALSLIFFKNLYAPKKENKLAERTVVAKKEIIKNTLIAGGDVILSRWVGVKIRASGDSAMPFRKIGPLMAQADITFINNEAPFLNTGPLITEGMSFKAEPEFIEGLKLAGVDVVSLANNHIKNQDREGMVFTFLHLEKNGIKFCGAGENFEAAHQPAILESKGIKFGFLAYADSDGIKFTRNEDPSAYDIAFTEILQMRSDVEKLKKEVDVVMVSMHTGGEYRAEPEQEKIDFAHAAIDAGANLVLGHHPHWAQTTEKYKNGYIIYSLGNLVFDQMWSEETREGVLVKIYFRGAKLKSVKFIPYKIENYSQPRLATEIESKKILKQMGLEKASVAMEN